MRSALISLLLCLIITAGQRPVTAEPLRIVYTAISLVYGPLWVTQQAGLFKKHNLDVELLYLSGGTLSTAALISGDVQFAFTGAANAVATNLTGADVVLLGATIDLLPFEVCPRPPSKSPPNSKAPRWASRGSAPLPTSLRAMSSSTGA
jgi:ABC-type nitrate/sulfonate/bicarbonate transport system substrate-binding protein